MKARRNTQSTPGGTIPRAVAIVALVAVAVGGCAYFNTLYNAKAKYREAATQKPDRTGSVTRSTVAMYDEVIEKCRKLIATWPNSRHVDDAMILIAKSYNGSDRYEDCVAILDSMETQLPDSELMPQALALEGAAYARWGRYEDAVTVLLDRIERFGPSEGVLFNLSTSLMSLDRSEEAVKYLGVLEQKYPKSRRTFDARISIAEILLEKEQYEESRRVYERLDAQRLPQDFRYRVWMGYANADAHLGRYDEALEILARVRGLVLNLQQEPEMLLLTARAYVGADSLDQAIDSYNQVTKRFSHGIYAADAHYELAQIFENADSLEAAKQHFELVSKAYPSSENARDAIKRAGSISQLLKLQSAADNNSPEAVALRDFSLAELQLFQFENVDKALEEYQRLVRDFPDTDLAPKAAYAVGYIYGVVLEDSARAWESYRYLRRRYPDSQQAAFADLFVKSFAAGADSVVGTGTVGTDSVAVDSVSAKGPVD